MLLTAAVASRSAQSLRPQLRVEGEGSAAGLQHQEQEQRRLCRGAEDESAGAARAQLQRPGLPGVEPLRAGVGGAGLGAVVLRPGGEVPDQLRRLLPHRRAGDR